MKGKILELTPFSAIIIFDNNVAMEVYAENLPLSAKVGDKVDIPFISLKGSSIVDFL